MTFIEKLKKRWHIESNFQVIVILIVFALTGFTVLFIKKPIYTLIGVSPELPWWQGMVIWLIVIFPFYYLILLMYGTLLGQRDFFLWFAKKSFGRFLKKKKPEESKAE
jgi:hypothetical protein